MGPGDNHAQSVIVKNSGTINGAGQEWVIGPGWTQITNFVKLQDNAQVTFQTISVLDQGLYCDGHGHGSTVEITDNAQLTATGNMYVVNYVADNNRTGTDYAWGQVWQSGNSSVTVGGNLSLANNDTAPGTGGATHDINATYNLAGGTLNVGGQIQGSASSAGSGLAYFNFHGGTLAYTGTSAQSDFINLSVNGANSVNNLRVWEGGTINTGGQNVTINQAILANRKRGSARSPWPVWGTLCRPIATARRRGFTLPAEAERGPPRSPTSMRPARWRASP